MHSNYLIMNNSAVHRKGYVGKVFFINLLKWNLFMFVFLYIFFFFWSVDAFPASLSSLGILISSSPRKTIPHSGWPREGTSRKYDKWCQQGRRKSSLRLLVRIACVGKVRFRVIETCSPRSCHRGTVPLNILNVFDAVLLIFIRCYVFNDFLKVNSVIVGRRSFLRVWWDSI